MEEKNPAIFWSMRNVLNIGALFHFVIGSRGCGKTFGTKLNRIRHFLNTGKKFIWLRRYSTEIKGVTGAANSFFDDLIREGKLKGHTTEVKLSKDIARLYIDDKHCGTMLSLTATPKFKSADFSEYDFIIFDEFLILQGSNVRYINKLDEPNILLEFRETVYRDRLDNGQILLLGNATDFANPYFLYFQIPIFKDTIYKRTNRYGTDICVEVVKNQNYIDYKRNTRFGQLITGTKYGDYAIDNTFFGDNSNFIDNSMGHNAIYKCNVIYREHTFAIYANYLLGLIYVNTKVDSTFPISYAITTPDHKPNTLLLDKVKNTFLDVVKRAFKRGLVRFENTLVKSIMMDVLGYVY